MKPSEVTVDILKNYIRIDTTDDDGLLAIELAGVKAYIKGQTGLDDAGMDTKEDLTLAVLVLCSEMYDNRQFTVDKTAVNPIVKSAIDMHSINLL